MERSTHAPAERTTTARNVKVRHECMYSKHLQWYLKINTKVLILGAIHLLHTPSLTLIILSHLRCVVCVCLCCCFLNSCLRVPCVNPLLPRALISLWWFLPNSPLMQELSFSRISESTTGYIFTPCVGTFTSPGIVTR